MIIRKCDVCAKLIKDEKLHVSAMSPKFLYKSFDFCKDCARKLVESLADRKLIEKTELEQFTGVKSESKI